jgi:uncharacterized protein YjbI with pentapeptide repeats
MSDGEEQKKLCFQDFSATQGGHKFWLFCERNWETGLSSGLSGRFLLSSQELADQGLDRKRALRCNVDFQNVNFQKVDFKNVNFKNVDFKNVNFQNVNFKNVNFKNVQLINGDFKNVDFKKC